MRRSADARIVDARVAEADVVGYRPREQVHVLQHEAEQAAQIGGIEIADVDAVDRDPTTPDVVKAQQQIDQRRLARAGRADDADALTRLDLEAHVPKHPVGLRRLLIAVREPDPVEHDVSGRRRGTPSRLRRRFDGGRFVEQLEDALGRRHRGLQNVELLRHVADRTEEAL